MNEFEQWQRDILDKLISWMRFPMDDNDDYTHGYNNALTDIIEYIESVQHPELYQPEADFCAADYAQALLELGTAPQARQTGD